MNTLNFLDANVWLALLWSRHIHSERPDPGFEQAGQEQFLFGRFSKSLFLDFHTEPIREWTQNYGGSLEPVGPDWADDRVVFVPEPEDIEKEFRARSRILPSRSPKVWQ